MRVPWIYGSLNPVVTLTLPHTRLIYKILKHEGEYIIWKCNYPERPFIVAYCHFRWQAKRLILNNIHYFSLEKSILWGHHPRTVCIQRTYIPPWLRE